MKNVSKIKVLFVAIMMFCNGLAHVTVAENVSKAADMVDQVADLGPGVHKVKRGDVGELLSCVVVGQARISKALGLTNGQQIARSTARLNAEKEFIKWFETYVTAIEYSANQQIIMLESDGETLKEAGKATESSGEVITSAAASAVRGLSVIGIREDGQRQQLTIVLGWKPENAAAAAQAKEINRTGNIPETTEEAPGESIKDVEIPSRSVVADEASEYF